MYKIYIQDIHIPYNGETTGDWIQSNWESILKFYNCYRLTAFELGKTPLLLTDYMLMVARELSNTIPSINKTEQDLLQNCFEYYGLGDLEKVFKTENQIIW